MSKTDEIREYLDAKFSADGKIQSDTKELFIYQVNVSTWLLNGVF